MDRGQAVLRATGQVMKFAGYTKVYEVAETDDAKAEAAEAADRLLPPLEVGHVIKLEAIRPEQHFTPAAAAVLRGIAGQGARGARHRPAVDLRVDHVDHRRPRYVEKREARFFPTELGILVNGLLVESFPEIVNSDFTAKMESDLDKVEEGAVDWRKLLGGFYTPFKDELEKARNEMRDVKREEIATEWTCEKCGKPMVIKWGRNGSFLACQGYPECRNTQEVVKNLDGTWEKVPPQTTDEVCEVCGAPMTVKRGRFRLVPGVHQVPGVQDHQADLAGRQVPAAGLRRVHRREAVAARQAVLRLLELGEEAVRLRGMGQAGPAAVSDLQREVRGQEGEQTRRNAAVPGV